MNALRQRAVQSAGRVGARRTARYSTAQHGKTGDEVHHFAGSSTEHGHHHAGPKDESLGVCFAGQKEGRDADCLLGPSLGCSWSDPCQLPRLLTFEEVRRRQGFWHHSID